MELTLSKVFDSSSFPNQILDLFLHRQWLFTIAIVPDQLPLDLGENLLISQIIITKDKTDLKSPRVGHSTS